MLVLNVLPVSEFSSYVAVLDRLCEQHRVTMFRPTACVSRPSLCELYRVAYIVTDSLCEQTHFTARTSYDYMFSTLCVSISRVSSIILSASMGQ
ncbi:hypothetical protein J1N35_014485 [Gossypium stocksii]|uniref:Uncharacterized protein n=1 Tax=Gossypium stocksii TaxID=47602 RepID=A0A9D4A9E4_9ROSI|nr:hypothetical protein J1N35_014485 [Gossypium stocksii]